MLSKNIKVDLHIHSKASSYKEDPGIVDESTKENLPTLFNKLKEFGIELISFTDHNVFDADLYKEARRLISTSDYSSIKGIIAGIEFDVLLDTSKPCHILAYFDCKSDEDYTVIESVMKNHKPDNKDYKYDKEEFEGTLKQIGLPVILVAYQRKGLDSSQGGGANSFSNAVGNFLEYLEIGYISAIEVQSPNVEGIVKNNLSDMSEFGNSIGMLIGIDCHEWAAYPNHDSKNVKEGNPYFTTIKALPSFRGLLLSFTSPETRFARDCQISHPYLKKISVNGKDIVLSAGVNAIIGENGSGKSTLLKIIAHNESEAHIAAIKKNNHIVVDQLPSKTAFVEQGNLFKTYSTSGDLSFGAQPLFCEVDASSFKALITNHYSSIISWLRRRIAATQILSQSKECSLTIRDDVQRKTFFISVSKGDFAADDFSEIEERATVLGEINNSLDDEISTYSHFYTKEELKALNSASKQLKAAVLSVQRRLSAARATSAAQNTVLSSISSYASKVLKLSNSFDKQATSYKDAKDLFVNKVVAQARAKLDLLIAQPSFPNLDHLREQGVGYIDKPAGGYIFRSYASYLLEDDGKLAEKLYMTLFLDGYDATNISAISSEDDLCKAVRGTRKNDKVDEKLKKNLETFLQEVSKTEHEIKDQATKKAIIGNTFGEKALIYYEVLLDKSISDRDVILIDQPEDNISNKRISEELTSAIQKLRDNAQVIIVTHNPLLVVNLDVDNVVIASGKRNKAGQFELSVVSGCLEDEECHSLEWIANYMDGGEKALARRLKAYGSRSYNN